MKRYKQVEVSETQLEDLARTGADLIEEGLKYVDHQRHIEKGRLDLLFIDSGHALVVAELKIIEDDAMLFQALDYFDYVSSNVEAFARLYNNIANIDPTQELRLFLIAPSFSQTLISRCKWIDANISLFIHKMIKFDDSEDIVPVFSEIVIPTRPELIVEKYTIEDRLAYITNFEIKRVAEEFLKQLQEWKKDKILIEPIKYAISIKVGGRVFMYLSPRRNAFVVETYNTEGKWTGFSVNSKEDLAGLLDLLKTNMEKRSG